MLRWLTAGESHGPELIAMLEGLPAGVPVKMDEIQGDLAGLAPTQRPAQECAVLRARDLRPAGVRGEEVGRIQIRDRRFCGAKRQTRQDECQAPPEDAAHMNPRMAGLP